MNFFEHQDKSRGNTFKLVFLFILAIVAMIAMVYGVLIGAYLFANAKETGAPISPEQFWNLELFAGVSAFLILVIGGRSLFQILMLSKGGSWVAESLGGRPISMDTKDKHERKFVNVVEEMAIASGTPVPSIYLLEGEEGINAFAAGVTVDDAAIAVTRGAIATLSRDELQGVVAHEFSHILNGDMRLNVRLMGLLAGIMALAFIGYLVIRMGPRRGKEATAFLIAGISLIVIGYGGVFAGRIIQSAISRQREYLADASAVQFTRNPAGIAGALKKIGGWVDGSKITSPAAQETSHMFFGEAISTFFGSMLATHPPLQERIKRLDPNFGAKNMEQSPAHSLVEGTAPAAGFAGAAPVLNSGYMTAKTENVMESVGSLSPELMARGSELIAAVPPRIKRELGNPLGACLIVCALLLDKDAKEREHQMKLLGEAAKPPITKEIRAFGAQLSKIEPELFLPLLDLALPALRQLSQNQFVYLLKLIDILIMANDKVTLFEFSLRKIIIHRLKAHFDRPSGKAKFNSFSPVEKDALNMLAALAEAGTDSRSEAEKAYRSSLEKLPITVAARLELPEGTIPFEQLGESFNRLAQSSAQLKKMVFEAATECVLYDDKVTLEESELLRATAYCLSLPLPPFLPGS